MIIQEDNCPVCIIKTDFSITTDLSTDFEIFENFDAGLDIGSIFAGDYPYYEDVYQVTPKINAATTLDTKDKVMVDNVTVAKIPYSSVSNIAGGNTITIGLD